MLVGHAKHCLEGTETNKEEKRSLVIPAEEVIRVGHTQIHPDASDLGTFQHSPRLKCAFQQVTKSLSHSPPPPQCLEQPLNHHNSTTEGGRRVTDLYCEDQPHAVKRGFMTSHTVMSFYFFTYTQIKNVSDT